MNLHTHTQWNPRLNMYMYINFMYRQYNFNSNTHIAVE